MISYLPIELVRLIIESTVPQTFDSTTYHDRQRTLCSLCLVSRQFKTIAQGLLLEIIWVRSVKRMNKLPIAKNDRVGEIGRKLVRWAIIEMYEVDDKKVAYASLRNFSEVESLTLANISGEGLDLTFLSSFQKLSSLHISGFFWIKPPSSPLSNLQALSIYRMSSPLPVSLLTPSLVPNLRALALPDCSQYTTLPDSDLKQLLPQLESLSIDMDTTMESEMEFLRSQADSTIVDTDEKEPGFYQLFEPELSVKHIRLCHLFFNDPYDREENLDYLGEFTTCLRENPWAPVRTIIVDSSLLLVLETPTQGRITVQRFQALCKERKIDIVYETLPRDINIDSSVSSEFWARQRQLKGSLRE